MKIFQKQNYGWFLFLFLCFIPALLWLKAPSEDRFSNFTQTMTNIGQLLGLIGAAMFGLNLILSARIPWLEKYFDGLNKVYEKHSLIGQIALILLLFHPLFLLPQYSSGFFRQAAYFLLPGTNWAQNFGIFSLILMIVLIVLTLYLRPKY